MRSACRALLLALLFLAGACSTPGPSQSIEITAASDGYRLSVPVSRLTMTLPQGNWSRKQKAIGGGTGLKWQERGTEVLRGGAGAVRWPPERLGFTGRIQIDDNGVGIHSRQRAHFDPVRAERRGRADLEDGRHARPWRRRRRHHRAGRVAQDDPRLEG